MAEDDGEDAVIAAALLDLSVDDEGALRTAGEFFHSRDDLRKLLRLVLAVARYELHVIGRGVGEHPDAVIFGLVDELRIGERDQRRTIAYELLVISDRHTAIPQSGKTNQRPFERPTKSARFPGEWPR